MPLLSTAVSYLIPLDTGEDSVRPVLPTTCLIPLSRPLTLNPLPSYLTPHPSYPTPSYPIPLHPILPYPTPHPSYPIIQTHLALFKYRSPSQHTQLVSSIQFIFCHTSLPQYT